MIDISETQTWCKNSKIFIHWSFIDIIPKTLDVSWTGLMIDPSIKSIEIIERTRYCAPVALYYIVSSCAFASSASLPGQRKSFRRSLVKKIFAKVTEYFLFLRDRRISSICASVYVQLGSGRNYHTTTIGYMSRSHQKTESRIRYKRTKYITNLVFFLFQ